MFSERGPILEYQRYFFIFSGSNGRNSHQEKGVGVSSQGMSEQENVYTGPRPHTGLKSCHGAGEDFSLRRVGKFLVALCTLLEVECHVFPNSSHGKGWTMTVEGLLTYWQRSYWEDQERFLF